MVGTASDSTEHVHRRELKGIRSGVENSAFSSSVVVRQQTAHLALTISYFCGLRELLSHYRDKLIVGGLGDDPVEL